MFLLLSFLLFGQAVSIPVAQDVKSKEWLYGDDRGDPILDAFFHDIFQDFMSFMWQGYPNLGIPPLDPFNNCDKEDNMTDFVMDVTVESESILSEGYSFFNVTSVDSNIETETLIVNMTLPTLYISGYYFLDGTVYGLFPVLGSGPFDITLFAITSSGTARLFMQDGGMAMDSLSLEPIRYSAMSPYFSNLMVSVPGSSDHIRSQVGKKIFQNVESEVRTELTIAIEAYLNEQLDAGAVPVPAPLPVLGRN